MSAKNQKTVSRNLSTFKNFIVPTDITVLRFVLQLRHHQFVEHKLNWYIYKNIEYDI